VTQARSVSDAVAVTSPAPKVVLRLNPVVEIIVGNVKCVGGVIAGHPLHAGEAELVLEKDTTDVTAMTTVEMITATVAGAVDTEAGGHRLIEVEEEEGKTLKMSTFCLLIAKRYTSR
jgi:hypothetical protein